MKKRTFLSTPNFLGSEVGLVTKTIEIDSDTQTTGVVTTDDGRQIVKAGTILTTPYKGLLFEDVDITEGGKVPAAVMISGRYIDAKLPATAAASVTDFEKQGLYAIVEGAVTRPY